MRRTALVTGHKGFIGRQVIAALDKAGIDARFFVL